jgi:hypothetical protein
MVGYRGTPMRDLGGVLPDGLLRARKTRRSLGCQHGGCISIAETPAIAATFIEWCGRVLVVDLEGLPGLGAFWGGETRVHGNIPPDRISLYEGPPVVPSLAGHVDPGKTPLGNHPACVHPPKLDGFDFATYREQES